MRKEKGGKVPTIQAAIILNAPSKPNKQCLQIYQIYMKTYWKQKSLKQLRVLVT